MTVRTRLEKVAERKHLRQSTVLSYKRLLGYLDVLDMRKSELTHDEVMDRLWTNIHNPNTRRSAAIAVRSVLGLDIKIRKGIARRYDLPDEETLRTALAHSPHEIRGLIMAYAGLRVGEACAVTAIQQLPSKWRWSVFPKVDVWNDEHWDMLLDNPDRAMAGKHYWDGNFRNFMAASPGCYLMPWDWSQVELRVMAGVSQEPALLKAFNEGDRPVHTIQLGDVSPHVPLLRSRNRASGSSLPRTIRRCVGFARVTPSVEL